MKALRAAFVRFAGLFHRKRREAEMKEELRGHIDALTARNITGGMSPDQAHYAALRTFGGVAQIAERARDERRSPWGEHLLQDLRYAVRQLGKTPGFTAVVVLSLALGIGANTAVFSRINDRLLKMLPVQNPGELVLFQWLPGPQGGGPPSVEGDEGIPNIDRESGQPAMRLFSLHTFEAFRGENAVLADVFAVAPIWGVNASIDGEAQLIGNAQAVSGNYYRVLGVPAFRGRTLTAEDERPAAAPVAVISHRLWQMRFAGDPATVGKVIQLNQTSVTIVGVMAPGFRDTIAEGEVTITLPLVLAPKIRLDGRDQAKPGHWWLRIVGRLKPGATIEQARASLDGRFSASARDGMRDRDKNDLPRLRAVPGGYSRTEADRQREAATLKIQMGITGLVLLAACLNVANLLLARGAVRRRELALRLALGASRGRLVRQLLTESVLLALLGAAVSACFSAWGIDLLSAVTPGAATPPLDRRVLGFSAALALLTSVGFGLAPALRATRLDLSAEFQGGLRHPRGGRLPLGKVLLVVQVALSAVLLVGAGLFIRTLQNLRTVEVGFNRERLLLFSVDAASAGYARSQFAGVHERVAERIAAVPGVVAVTFANWPMLGNSAGRQIRVWLPGGEPSSDGRDHVKYAPVATNYFNAYEMPVLSGRGFEPRDAAATARVAVINRTFARKFFGDENPVGRQIRKDYRGNAALEIVGVVGDVKYQDLRTPAAPMIYVPFAHDADSSASFTVRAAGEPAVLADIVRKAVREVDRNVPLADVHTQDEEVEGNLLWHEHLFARMSVCLGGLALALVCVGLYGLMSYAVQRRTSEIGLRMALGALPRRIVGMILRESLGLVAAGVIAGMAAAAVAVRMIASMLYGLSPTDPSTYAGVALLLGAVALLACLLPARRAAKIDPMVALRAE